jgi:hypothetical protein
MSTLKADTIQSTSGGAATLTKQSAAKAWQNLNGSTFGLRDSFNTASSTDNGTGDYSHTMTNAMSDADYAVLVTSRNEATNTNSANNIHQGTAPTASVFRMQHIENGSATDAVYVSSSVDGDLA